MENVGKKAQVIILAGFLLAIGVIAVTLVLNGLIFSQDVASRDDGVPEREVIQFRNSVNETLQEAVTNNGTYSPDVAEMEYERFLNEYEEQVNEQLLRRQAEVVFEESPSSHDKTVAWAVGQRGVGEYTNTTGGAEWVVAEDISDVYRLDFNVSMSSVGGAETLMNFSTGVTNIGPIVTINNGWELDLRETGSGNLEVEADGYGFETGNGISFTVVPDSGHATFSLWEEVEGEFSDPPSAARFEDGDEIEGSYEFRFDDGATDVGPCTAPCRNSDDSTPPQKYAVGVVHKAKDIAFEYANRRVTYNETLTVTAKQDEINAGFGGGSGSGGSGSVSGDSSFAVTITGSNSPVEAGDTVEVKATVENTGTEDGTKDIELMIEGVTEDTKTGVHLDSGSSTTVTLDWNTDSSDDGGAKGKDHVATIKSPDSDDSTNVRVCDKTTGNGNKCTGGGSIIG
jgi:hypothetical protein